MQKFYSLDPQFYFPLFYKDITNRQLPTNKSLKHLDFEHRLKKALSGRHDCLLFDSSFFENINFDSYIKQALESNIKPAVQITADSLNKYKDQILSFSKNYKANIEFHFIFKNRDQISFKELESLSSPFLLVYIVIKKNKNIPLSKNLTKESFHKIRLYFPYKKHLFDSFLTPRQVYAFINKNNKIPRYPVEIYDSRIPYDMDLEPCALPFVENTLPNNNIYFSIIIPSYNRKTELINTIKNLAKQDFSRNEYEIIAVDDGSNDNTRSALREFVKQNPCLNIKAIHFPRVIEKKSGDSRFRAGLARNLGVKHSQGKFLAFLDSDILTPPDYLKRLKIDHKTADLVFLKRYHLKPKAPIEDLFSAYKDLKDFYYIEDKKYWGNFYKKGFDQVKCPWKYICTYGLSLLKKDFEKIGAFGKSFVFYGFEDIDLGYRMFKQNKKFLLSDIEVYHQAPAFTPKGNWNSFLLRQRQLAKTAKIFFYRHLDPEIYKELIIYMRQDRPLSYFFPFLKKLFP